MAPIARVRKRRDDTHPPADRPLKKRRKETSHVSKKSELWEAREIIDESATHYLIEWEGLDSGTGKPYEPTWEPKSNANTPLRKSWALFKAGLKSSTKKKTLGDEHPEALSSSPPVQPPSGKQLRGLTFSHSQPTPDQTPDSSNTVAEWATRTASAAPAQTGSAPDRPSVAVVPSQRPFIPELYEALQTQLPEPPSSPYYTRRKRRLHLPEIPDSESSGDSSSYEPTAPSGSRAHATTQLSSSSSAPRLSSPIEEISQFRYSERQLEVESDPIADPISPITQGRRSKKVWAVVGSPLRKSVIAESTVTTGDAAAPPGVHLSGPYVIHSSASEQAESAPRTSGTAEIAQTIEQSPSASVALVEDRQSPDQADVSTEGEYSGSHAARHAKHRGQSRATGVLSEGSASFASRSPRTPPNAMNGQADDSPAGQSPPLTARSLQEKLAELDDVGLKRGRPLHPITLAKTTEEATRSPSAIPDKEPPQEQPGLGQRSRMQVADFGPELRVAELPVAVHDEPHAEDTNMSEPLGNDGGSSPLSDAPDVVAEPSPPPEPFPNLGPSEYVVVLPNAASSTDAYRKHITAHANLIEDFCSRPWEPNAEIVGRVAKLAQQLRNYVTHSDLENEEAMTQQTQSFVAPDLLAEWDMNVSSKFCFLGHFLKALSRHRLHVVVVAGDEPVLDKVESFCRGLAITLRGRRSSEPEATPVTSDLIVSVVLAGGEPGAPLDHADVIISLDNAIDTSDELFRSIRGPTQQLSQVIHLFVNFAIEHIERCIPRDVVGVDRLQRLLATSALYRRQAGRLYEHPRPKEAAMALAEYFLAKPTAPSLHWPIPEAGIVTIELPSNNSTSVSTNGDEPHDVTVGQKRSLDDDLDVESNKRVRLDEQPTSGSSGEPNASLISDSAVTQDSSAGASFPPGSGGDAERQPSLVPAATSTLASETSSAAATRMLEMRHRVVDLDTALEDLQLRFEDQTRDLRAARKEHEAAKTQAAIFQKQVDARNSMVTKLKEERDGLKEQLRTTSERLAASDIPGVVELERLRTALAAAEEGRRKAEAKYTSQETTMSYIRTQYQQASDQAVELSRENTDLKGQVEELTKRASTQAVELKKLVNLDRETAWKEEVEGLQGRVGSLEMLVLRLQEENHSIKTQGRVQTRQGSMPPTAAAVAAARSPRMGPVSRIGSPVPTSLGLGASRLRDGGR